MPVFRIVITMTGDIRALVISALEDAVGELARSMDAGSFLKWV